MNRMNSEKGSWICFAGITFTIMVLFFMSSCDVSAPTVVSAPTGTPTMTSPPTATDTPTPTYPAPILVNPTPGAAIVGEKLTSFSWQWNGAMQEGEKYDLRIWRPGKPCCTVAMLDESSYLLDTPPDGFGQYRWQVAVVRIDAGDSKSTLSESLIWPFVWSDVTPTPTFTATPTPTSIPDAVVNVEALNLRSGPGVVYDILRVLKKGDPLKVIGKCPVGDWLKVITPDGQEGWVAALYLEINVPMADVALAQAPPMPTPMYTPTPTVTPTPELLPPPVLLEPEDGTCFIGWPVILKWQWNRPRAPDEIFSLRVRREGETELCHHAQVRDLEYWGDFAYCSAGKHYWGVTLVRQLCTDCPEKERWQQVSEPSAERWIYYIPGDEQWEWPSSPDDGDDDGGGGGDPGPPRPSD